MRLRRGWEEGEINDRGLGQHRKIFSLHWSIKEREGEVVVVLLARRKSLASLWLRTGRLTTYREYFSKE